MPRIGKESHVAQFLKLAHTGLKFDRYEQPQNVVVELNNKKNPVPLVLHLCYSILTILVVSEGGDVSFENREKYS